MASKENSCKCEKRYPKSSTDGSEANNNASKYRTVDPETAKKLMLQGIDPNCIPDQPLELDIADAEAAVLRIHDGVKHHPCMRSHLSDVVGMEIYLKPECFQFTGAFKERGCRNAFLLLSEEQKKRGIVTASSGNQAQAASYHGMLLNIKVIVIMPYGSSVMKMEKVKKFKGTIILHGNNVNESAKFGLKYAAENDMVYINGFDHYDIMAGLATISFEILQEVPDVDVVLMPIGGGGLISGNSKVFKSKKPSIKCIGLESKSAASFHESLKANKRTGVVAGPLTIADGIYVPMIGVNTFATGRRYIDEVLVIDDEFISMAMVRLIELDKIVAEGAGAIGIAAILAHKLEQYKGKKIVSIISGGNVDSFVLCRAIDRGLASEGRYIKVKCWVQTKIGQLQELCRFCEENGAEIKYIRPETCWLMSDVFSQSVKLILFTKSYDETIKLKTALEQRYEVLFEDFSVDKIPYPTF